MANELELEVFKTGDYGGKGSWDEAALDGLAADYDPKLHEAPVTVDHAQTGPALGWVESLRRVGDRLVARLRGVSGRLLEMIREGAFKKRSVEIYPAMKESGRPYLRAVSFLGAASPEVKGLIDPTFTEDGAADESKGEKMLFADGRGEGEEFDYDCEHAHERETEGGENSEYVETEDLLAFAEMRNRLQAGGKWQPVWGERGIAEFYRALAAVDEIEVGDGQSVNAAEWFARFLEELPAVVTLGETAAGNANGNSGPSMTRGGNVDPDSTALHRRVVRFMEENEGIGYGEALRRCAR